MILYETKGILRYSRPNDEFRCVVDVDASIANYYRDLLPRWFNAQKPRWPAHVTVVRNGRDVPQHMEFWDKYEGEEVELLYAPGVKQGKIYWWLDVYSVRLENILEELGLYYISRYHKCPTGFRKVFHMTIGNCKDVQSN